MRISSGGSEFVNILQTDTVTMRGHDKVTSDGLAFTGWVYQAAASSNYAHCQLKNPSSSGVVLLLDRVIWSSSTETSMYVKQYGTDLTTDYGDGVNQNIGGSAGSAQMRAQNHTSIYGTMMIYIDHNYQSFSDITFPYPVEIGEGEGIITITGAVNLINNTVFFYREV